MCGFIGFVSRENETADMQLAAAMLSVLRHRGPDDARVVRHGELTLGHCALPFTHRRFPIQPFVTATGHTVVVFNGEIYNHHELGRELARHGFRPRTSSDTEVLAELLEREGTAALARIRGMFAFVAHDVREGRTILVRDPLGKKPLYYLQDGHGDVVFASEMSALLRHPACPTQPDPTALADYLVLQAVPAPRSMLTGVRKVSPGTYLEVTGEVWREKRYWFPPPPTGHVSLRSPRAAEEGLEMVLREAVGARLDGSDRQAVLLSGGLDSSMVAALLTEITGRPPVAFSIGFTDHSFDESPAAALVARHLDSEHHHLRLSPRDLADGVLRWYDRVDEPLADPSLLPTTLAFELAGRHVRTLQTGDGADEILLGYRYFQAERVLGLIDRAVPTAVTHRLPGMLARLPVRHGNLPLTAVARQLGRALDAPPERRFYLSTAPVLPSALRRLLTGPVTADPFRDLDHVAETADGLDALARSQAGIITHFLRDVILTKLDRSSMLSSVEARSPFLDEAVVGYCAQLPRHLKLRRFTGKYLLRRLASRRLPNSIAYGVKRGFRAPIATLLTGELRPFLLDTLSPRRLDRHGLLRPEAVAEMSREHLTGQADHARALWALLCFQIWHDTVSSTVTAGRPSAPVHLMEGPHDR